MSHSANLFQTAQCNITENATPDYDIYYNIVKNAAALPGYNLFHVPTQTVTT
jgi:hypothetical protein